MNDATELIAPAGGGGLPQPQGRFSRWLTLAAAAWWGASAAVGLLVAPTLFASLPRAEAGHTAGLLFAADAKFSVLMAGLLYLLLRAKSQREQSQEPEARHPAAWTGLSLWLLAALFCTVLGHFGLAPWVEQAKAGQGPFSFAALHAISTAFFLGKLACVGVLAWRLSLSRSS